MWNILYKFSPNPHMYNINHLSFLWAPAGGLQSEVKWSKTIAFCIKDSIYLNSPPPKKKKKKQKQKQRQRQQNISLMKTKDKIVE